MKTTASPTALNVSDMGAKSLSHARMESLKKSEVLGEDGELEW